MSLCVKRLNLEDVPCRKSLEGVDWVLENVAPKFGGGGVEIECCVVSWNRYLCC